MPLRQNWPPPYQDKKGRWWFYDPETGYTNSDIEKERIREAFPNITLPKFIKGHLFLSSTVEDSDNSAFKQLWDKSL